MDRSRDLAVLAEGWDQPAGVVAHRIESLQNEVHVVSHRIESLQMTPHGAGAEVEPSRMSRSVKLGRPATIPTPEDPAAP